MVCERVTILGIFFSINHVKKPILFKLIYFFYNNINTVRVLDNTRVVTAKASNVYLYFINHLYNIYKKSGINRFSFLYDNEVLETKNKLVYQLLSFCHAAQ